MAEQKITDMSFEESLKELEEIVRTLETGGLDLEKSIKNYERGTSLKNNCESKLNEAKLKVEKITSQDQNGNVNTEPFPQS